MIRKLGFITKNLGNSHKSYSLIKSINKLLEEKTSLDIVGFYETFGKYPITPNFAIMQVKNIWGFYGDILTTDYKCTEMAIASPTINNIYFYVWDLEWIYDKKDYLYYMNIYQHDRVNLIARSESHYEELKKNWKEPIGIMRDFDNEQFCRLFKVK